MKLMEEVELYSPLGVVDESDIWKSGVHLIQSRGTIGSVSYVDAPHGKAGMNQPASILMLEGP